MKQVTIERKDSAGLPVTETINMLEPKDYTAALADETLAFQRQIEQLVDRGLQLDSFIFLFRAEKGADGKMIYDRFFIDQPSIDIHAPAVIDAITQNPDFTTAEVAAMANVTDKHAMDILRRAGYRSTLEKHDGRTRPYWRKA